MQPGRGVLLLLEAIDGLKVWKLPASKGRIGVVLAIHFIYLCSGELCIPRGFFG